MKLVFQWRGDYLELQLRDAVLRLLDHEFSCVYLFRKHWKLYSRQNSSKSLLVHGLICAMLAVSSVLAPGLPGLSFGGAPPAALHSSVHGAKHVSSIPMLHKCRTLHLHQQKCWK